MSLEKKKGMKQKQSFQLISSLSYFHDSDDFPCFGFFLDSATRPGSTSSFGHGSSCNRQFTESFGKEIIVLILI